MQYTIANVTYFCINSLIDNQDHNFKGMPLVVIQWGSVGDYDRFDDLYFLVTFNNKEETL